jgi:hypothetical protein
MLQTFEKTEKAALMRVYAILLAAAQAAEQQQAQARLQQPQEGPQEALEGPQDAQGQDG